MGRNLGVLRAVPFDGELGFSPLRGLGNAVLESVSGAGAGPENGVHRQLPFIRDGRLFENRSQSPCCESRRWPVPFVAGIVKWTPRPWYDPGFPVSAFSRRRAEGGLQRPVVCVALGPSLRLSEPVLPSETG